jgi:hypothetical protein
MADRSCTCPASVYGGFKHGVGLGLGTLAVAAVPVFLLVAFALPAYLGALARKAATEKAAASPTNGSLGRASALRVLS